MSKGFMYILKCSDGSYYTGSTKNIIKRIWQHNNEEGAKYVQDRLPFELVYFEEFSRIDFAFNREHQIKKWSRHKKEALIESNYVDLIRFSKNYSQNTAGPSTGSGT